MKCCVLGVLLVPFTLVLLASPLHAEDQGWPRVHKLPEGEVTVYQPQIVGWDRYQTLHFRVAIAVQRAGQASPEYGSVVGQALTQVSWDERTVLVSQASYPEIRFPAAPPAVADACTAIARKVADPSRTWQLSLDRIVADLRQAQEAQKQAPVSLDPPPIHYAPHDAVLVIFLGPPSWKPIPGTGLMFATNSNWTVIMDPTGGRFYLLDGESWLSTTNVSSGPWMAAAKLPAGFDRLPDDDSWKDVKARVPGKPLQTLPQVFVSERPAELIVTDGDPRMVTITSTELLYVSNTDSDLFLHFGTGTYYFLSCGRWFSASALTGPWAAATTALPADFAKIPIDNPRARVLASVPGTPQAEEAVLLASIPRTAKVSRADATIEVTYQGEPHFVPVNGADGVFVADNTADVVFRVASSYYCCRDGIWFQAAEVGGPWTVCERVPAAIYTIPSDSPYHNVTYVEVYDATPTTVTVGYTSGYAGEYVFRGALLFGAGYWLGRAYAESVYAPWHYTPTLYAYGTAARYDYYAGRYARGAAYYGPYGGAGYGARYDPATGTYARGAAAYGPYRGAGTAAAYNPWTGARARGAAAYGPRGAAAAGAGYNPATGRAGATAQRSTPYGSWGRSVVSSGAGWTKTGHASSAWGKTAGWETSRGGAGVVHEGPRGTTGVVKTRTGNVYAGHDGNVYRHTPKQGWERHTPKGWQSPGWKSQGAQRHSVGSPPRAGAGAGDVQHSLDRSARNRQYGNYKASRSRYGGHTSRGGHSGGGRRGRRR